MLVCGCDGIVPTEPLSGIGLTRSTDGRVQILYNGCASEGIEAYRVLLPNAHPVYDPKKSRTLWDVRRGTGSLPPSIDAPVGSVTKVPLDAASYESAPDVVFVVVTTRRDRSAAIDFKRIISRKVNYDGHIGSVQKFDSATRC
jgi:hypothetical protein